MEKTLLVKGMSCGHCEMAVKKAIGAVDGVNMVNVNLQTGKVIVKGDALVDSILKEVVDDAGYEVVSIE
ncbi:MAG: heavy-metal-associated domain-containing protein [Clostridia bacterium]|nr:heavy-metal-associated domain-containing protein [Clostridia bacterium]